MRRPASRTSATTLLLLAVTSVTACAANTNHASQPLPSTATSPEPLPSTAKSFEPLPSTATSFEPLPSTATSLEPTPAMHPTEFDCAAAPTPGELTDLATGSAVVVEATVASAAQAEAGAVNVYDTPISDVKVVGSRGGVATTSAPTMIRGSDVDWSKLLGPGRYLIFLLDTGAPTNGMRGVFRIRNGLAEWMCPSANNPVHPSTAAGRLPAAIDLESQIPVTLPTFTANKTGAAATP